MASAFLTLLLQAESDQNDHDDNGHDGLDAVIFRWLWCADHAGTPDDVVHAFYSVARQFPVASQRRLTTDYGVEPQLAGRL